MARSGRGPLVDAVAGWRGEEDRMEDGECGERRKQGGGDMLPVSKEGRPLVK